MTIKAHGYLFASLSPMLCLHKAWEICTALGQCSAEKFIQITSKQNLTEHENPSENCRNEIIKIFLAMSGWKKNICLHLHRKNGGIANEKNHTKSFLAFSIDIFLYCLLKWHDGLHNLWEEGIVYLLKVSNYFWYLENAIIFELFAYWVQETIVLKFITATMNLNHTTSLNFDSLS